MAYNTAILQGRFTSDGNAKFIALRSDVDWMYTYNETTLSASGAGTVVKSYWQRGMTDNSAWIYTKTAVTDALVLDVTAAGVPGFHLYDPSTAPIVGAAVATSAISNAADFVVSTADTTGLSDGVVVRLASTAAVPNIMGFDFAINTIIANTSFTPLVPIANVPGAVGGAGTYRIVNIDSPFYPRRRFVVDITNAASAVVSVSVPHGYTVGQKVRLLVPAEFDMIEMNNLSGTITAVGSTTTFTVDIDSTAFTTFVWPAVSDYPFSFAEVVPFGEDTASALINAVDILADATENQWELGMVLGAGSGSPAGVTSDVIYWVAGKSFSVDNQ